MSRRREENEGSFWISYSDLTTGLLLVFILLVAVLVEKREQEMSSLKEKNTSLEAELRGKASQLARPPRAPTPLPCCPR